MLCGKPLCDTNNINYSITKSEVVTGKSQTEALPYWPSNSEVNTVGQGLRFSHNDQTENGCASLPTS